MKTRKINHRTASTEIGRQNGLKMWILEKAFGLSGFARILIENIVRTRFGERYFSFSATILTLLFFAFWPYIAILLTHNPFQFYRMPTFWEIIWHNLLLYIYLAVVFYFSLKRRKEVNELPSVFDFARYSRSTGFIDKVYLNFIFQGRLATIREIETFWEPLPFFAAGLFLAVLDQSLGYVLLFCSLIYALGYCAAYHYGDNKMMDLIDDTIRQEELMGVVVDGKDKAQARGYSFMGKAPNSAGNRRKVVSEMLGDDEFEDVN